mmetsp:Transcript_20279/g.77630  ORF Transcript_20279/g.77630 Transcript_20279/m.77630 type:complete len:160 (+) Transcript_20279:64-543(+)
MVKRKRAASGGQTKRQRVGEAATEEELELERVEEVQEDTIATEDGGCADEEETEEEYIVLELEEYEGIPNFLRNRKNYSLIGLETDTPILQVDGHLFLGRYEHVLGTALAFRPLAQGDEGAAAAGQPHHAFHSLARKKIVFKKARLVPKTPSAPVESST